MFLLKLGVLTHPSIFSLLLSVIMWASIQQVQSDHTTICIALPGIRYKRGMKSMGMEKFPQGRELWSKLEEPIVAGAVQVHPSDQREGFFPSSNPLANMKVYLIKDKRTDVYLNGWFRIEIDVVEPKVDLQKSLKALVLYTQDDHNRRQSIGEFSLNFPTQGKCPKNDANRYMIISCGGASRSEPLVSNVIVLVRNNSDLDGNIFPAGVNDIMPSLKGKHNLNFYVRIPIQDCNQKQYILFRARLILDKNVVPGSVKEDVLKLASAYFRIDARNDVDGIASIAGGSDALPSPSNAKHLDCGEEMTASNLPWYAWQTGRYNDLNFQNSGFSNYPVPEEYRSIYACQGFYFRGRCPENFYTFYVRLQTASKDDKPGRLLKNQNEARENVIPICEHVPTGKHTVPGLIAGDVYYPPMKFNKVKIGFPKSHDYLKMHDYSCSKVYNEDKTCNISMITNYLTSRSGGRTVGRHRHGFRVHNRLNDYPATARADDDEDSSSNTYLNYSGNSRDPIKDMYHGVGFKETGFPKMIWGLRKGHATLMMLAMFFVLPVNLFITRYYKESFMDKRILYSRIWYQVHIQGTFIMGVLLFSGLIIAIVAKQYMGASLTAEAKAHRVLGWFTICLFIILTSSGGIRGFEEPLRKISIIGHWLLGMLFYLLMVAEMLTAVFIPASGVTSNDRSTQWRMMEDRTFLSGSFLHVVIWIIVEMVMHAVMMGNMLGFDRKMAIVQRRIYFPVPIPVIKEHSRVNASGHGLRVIALAVYVMLALSSTALYFIANIINVDGKEFGLGPMRCSHDPTTHKIRHTFVECE